jgi:hypothetical protein
MKSGTGYDDAQRCGRRRIWRNSWSPAERWIAGFAGGPRIPGGPRPRGVDHAEGAQGRQTVAAATLRIVCQPRGDEEDPTARGQPGSGVNTERHGVLFQSHDAWFSSSLSDIALAEGMDRNEMAPLSSESICLHSVEAMGSWGREVYGRVS